MQPWENEPDIWIGEGMVATRHPDSGHWCGYIMLPMDHPWMQVEETWDVLCDVHGGVTWRENDLPDYTRDRVGSDFYPDYGCVGFDCHHSEDYAPYYKYRSTEYGEVYRDLEFVKGQILHMARQAMRDRNACFQ